MPLCGADDPKKTQHLLSLDGAEERLRLFEANLLKEGSFDSVVDGCEAVFHTASPVNLSPLDPQVCPFHEFGFAAKKKVNIEWLRAWLALLYETRRFRVNF